MCQARIKLLLAVARQITTEMSKADYWIEKFALAPTHENISLASGDYHEILQSEQELTSSLDLVADYNDVESSIPVIQKNVELEKELLLNRGLHKQCLKAKLRAKCRRR